MTQQLRTSIGYRKVMYIGATDDSLKGKTALASLFAGYLKVQVDDLSHDWSHGWHVTPISDWELLEDTEELATPEQLP